MADRIADRIGIQLQHRSLLAAIATGLDPDHAPEILKQLVTAAGIAMAQGFYSAPVIALAVVVARRFGVR